MLWYTELYMGYGITRVVYCSGSKCCGTQNYTWDTE